MKCVITGASRGIGRAIAVEMASKFNAQCLLVYRNQSDAVEQTASLVKAAGGQAHILQADLSTAEAASGVVDVCIQAFGGIDVLVNNAGITADGLSLQMSDEQWHSVIQTNLSAAFYTARAAARPMMLQKRGRIINLSSIAAKRPNRGQVNYVASKGGIEAFTRALAVELAPKGVTVNAIAPGIIETDMSARIRDAAGKELKKAVPARRFGTPQDVAPLVAFLAGDDAAYITGQVIGVDGGLSA
jgi:3-oxoacyl-[acyl-carrier protein] reductase